MWWKMGVDWLNTLYAPTIATAVRTKTMSWPTFTPISIASDASAPSVFVGCPYLYPNCQRDFQSALSALWSKAFATNAVVRNHKQESYFAQNASFSHLTKEKRN
jgi:hypothetical protein